MSNPAKLAANTDLRRDDEEPTVPVPPGEDPPPPVEEPPDKPVTAPDAPVREPGPKPARRLAS